ncbi:MAG: hypothetical protein KJ952_04475 [Candidatus Omnitrophica bacterium]|nr:hypothetical protein [Candidatus Omnitrophota bacterium]
MLKRYQVLLDEWLARHLQIIAKKYDISFSETIRWCTCMHAGRSISKAYKGTKFKSEKFDKRHLEIVRKRNKKGIVDDIEVHRFLSDLYYETRKAIEDWEKQEKKKNKAYLKNYV